MSEVERIERAIKILSEWVLIGKVGEPSVRVGFDDTADNVEDALDLAVRVLREKLEREKKDSA